MIEQNLKFIALHVPEIIGDIHKHVGSPWIPGTANMFMDISYYLRNVGPGYANAALSPKFLTGFCSDGSYECTGQI